MAPAATGSGSPYLGHKPSPIAARSASQAPMQTPPAPLAYLRAMLYAHKPKTGGPGGHFSAKARVQQNSLDKRTAWSIAARCQAWWRTVNLSYTEAYGW
eukprot:1157490-Pelagomonas_calceolata.AAC.4